MLGLLLRWAILVWSTKEPGDNVLGSSALARRHFSFSFE
jgi:hypothetical protein